jgi:putative ABC transport system permease protein
MNIPFRPIITALLRNRTGALLVAVQIAIALAVLVNAVYIVKQRVDHVGRPTGMDTDNIFVISTSGFAKSFNYSGMLDEDITWLRSLPGVISASPINSVPLSNGGSSAFVTLKSLDPTNRMKSNYFESDARILDTLGVKLLKGRFFRDDEVLPAPKLLFESYSGPIVITQEYADHLFPNGDALGKTVYEPYGAPVTIIGIMDHMIGSWVTDDQPTDIMLLPRLPAGPNTRYLVRTTPGQRDVVMSKVEAELGARNRSRAINYVRTMDYYKARSYLTDRNMAIFLTTVTTLLLAITSLGIFGLATFSVSTRTKQVGTRRAVGARRLDIVTYFLVENWLITTVGVVVGCIMALGVGQWLSLEYKLPRVDLYYLVGGTLALWLIGLGAAWQPARRASKISPALATRTV